MKVIYVEITRLNKYLKVAFAMYIIILFIISFLGVSWYSPKLQADYIDVSHNITPFKTIFTYILNLHHYNFDTWFYNTIGNVLMFIPLGFLLPLTSNNFKRFTQTIVTSVILSFSIEFTQYLAKLGVFNIDKIILNFIGCSIGFYAFKLTCKLTQRE
ncbi:VanZ family protein [Radiobacillus sp. PE A8.2]|uniref:VanZ family protein n=1 Tax=Radiobacillus sp. PE A8.2 TaxID=3380349 RepID=UPI00388F9F52